MDGYEYEADPRQAEKFLESLNLGAGCNTAATPGVKPLVEQLQKDNLVRPFAGRPPGRILFQLIVSISSSLRSRFAVS